MTQQGAGYPAEKDRLKETVTDQIKDTTESARQLAGKAAEQVGQYAEQARDTARQFRPFVEKSLKEQPIATLAAAAAIAFVLGALWKR
jgi:ElaB/YqjD/DUF883 family membrane-anchored ribosome-binding protein